MRGKWKIWVLYGSWKNSTNSAVEWTLNWMKKPHSSMKWRSGQIWNKAHQSQTNISRICFKTLTRISSSQVDHTCCGANRIWIIRLEVKHTVSGDKIRSVIKKFKASTYPQQDYSIRYGTIRKELELGAWLGRKYYQNMYSRCIPFSQGCIELTSNLFQQVLCTREESINEIFLIVSYKYKIMDSCDGRIERPTCMRT